MAKFMMDQTSDMTILEPKKMDAEPLDGKRKIGHCLHRQLIFTNPKECLRQKRVKNYEGLYEQEDFLVPFSTVRRQLLTLNRSSAQKKTLSVHLEFYTTDEILKILNRMLPKHSSLRALHLIFNEEIKFEAWKRIGRLLSRFSHLTSLVVNFRQKKPEMRDKDLASVQRSITMLTRLNYLCFAVTQNEKNQSESGYLRAGFIVNTNHKTEGFLYRLTTRLKKLEAMCLKVVEIDSLTDEGIQGFSRALSQLQNMKDVSLKLHDCPRITNEGCFKFLDNLQKSPHLKKLGMTMTVSEIYRESKVLPLLHPIWTSKELEYVNLDLKFLSLFPVEAIENTMLAIERLRCLGKLVICFHGTHHAIVGKITNLIAKCAELPRLTELTVRFMNCLTLDYVTANNMIYAVNSCPHLKKAEIEFLSCFKKIEAVTTEIVAPLVTRPNLKDLNLSFIDCTDLTENQMDRIIELFMQCENLQSLVLKVNWCKSFLDRHFQKFAKAISAMQFLEHITLGLEGCNGITRVSAPIIEKLLSKLTLLRYFDLNFSYLPDVANDDLAPLGEWISGLKCLEGMKLSFKNCKKVTDEGVKLFCSKLNGMRKLGTIMLVWSSGSIRELSKMLGSQLAMSLPNLYCIELHAVKKSGQISKVCIRLTA